MIHCYEDLDSEPHGVTFIKHDELMLIQFAGCIKAMNEAGDIVYSIETPSPMYQLCLAGPGKTVIGIFIEQCVKLYDAADGKLTSTVKLDCQKFNAGSIVFGVEGINAGNVIADFSSKKVSAIVNNIKLLKLQGVTCPPRWRRGNGLDCRSDDPGSIPNISSQRVGSLMARR